MAYKVTGKGVPSVDSEANTTINEVIGNREDKSFSDSSDYPSVIGHLTAQYYHVHAKARAYPPAADPIAVASSAASAWTHGNKITIIGTQDTLDNAAAADQGGTPNVVRIPCTGHSYSVGMFVTIAGSTNYNGTFEIVATAADTFDIESAFTAETFAGTETVVDEMVKKFDCHFVIATVDAADDYELKLWSGAAGSEVCIGTVAFTRASGFVNTSQNIPIQIPPQAHDNRISCSLACGDGDGAAATVKLYLHRYLDITGD